MNDFTDADAIKVGRMVVSGSTWADVVQELYPDTKYPELLADLTCERFRAWYRQQTPQRLMEVFA